jgi:hypothetical protein
MNCKKPTFIFLWSSSALEDSISWHLSAESLSVCYYLLAPPAVYPPPHPFMLQLFVRGGGGWQQQQNVEGTDYTVHAERESEKKWEMPHIILSWAVWDQYPDLGSQKKVPGSRIPGGIRAKFRSFALSPQRFIESNQDVNGIRFF